MSLANSSRLRLERGKIKRRAMAVSYTHLEAVRLKFFTDYGVLANLFDVYSGDTFALRIGIEQSPTDREHYRLRFLNSYGCLLYTSGRQTPCEKSVAIR